MDVGIGPWEGGLLSLVVEQVWGGGGGGGGIERADGSCWRLCVFCLAFVWFLPLSLVIAVFHFLSKAIVSFISLAR